MSLVDALRKKADYYNSDKRIFDRAEEHYQSIKNSLAEAARYGKYKYHYHTNVTQGHDFGKKYINRIVDLAERDGLKVDVEDIVKENTRTILHFSWEDKR